MSSFFLLISALLTEIVLPSYPGMSCYSDGGYINDWDYPINNIQSSYFLNGVVSSYHNNHHEDRRWRFKYCKPPTTAFIAQGSLSTTPYDSYWYRDCNEINTNAAMIGATSSHDNDREDRQWVWYCGVLDTKYYLTGCFDTGYLNSYDGTFAYQCPNNGVIRRIYSVHDNDNEDRRWGFYCCRVKDIPTQSPTQDPTPSPTNYPTHDPTTPAPTDPGTMICGDIDSGAYNNDPIDFVVRMPYKGDLTFNASNSDFGIDSITVVFGTTPIDFINSNVVTITDIEVIGDYKFTLTGSNSGTYNVRIYCQSDNPTSSPTNAPTPAPTVNPSHSPTLEPTGEPTMEPTFEPTGHPSVEPTLAPSISPIPAPTNAPHPQIVIGKPTEPPTSDGGEVTEQAVDEKTTAINENKQGKSLLGSTDNLLLLYIGVGIGVFAACCIICCFLLILKIKSRKSKLKNIGEKLVVQSPMSTGGTTTAGETDGPTAGIEMTSVHTDGNDTNVNLNGNDNDNVLPQLPDEEQNIDGLYDETNVNRADGMLVHNVNTAKVQTVGNSSSDSDDVPSENENYMYKKNNTNTKGIENKTINQLCNECGKSVETNGGQIDQNDGNFYCNNCWNSFYE